MKHELQNIISGKSQVSNGDSIQAIARYIRNGNCAGTAIESGKQIKRQEATLIKQFCNQNDFWIQDLNINTFVSSGAEQKVYLYDKFKVIKLNDSIYYETWEDYFNNLLLNNYFFPDTSYRLIGFHVNGNILYAVVEQAFIESDCITNLENVKLFFNSKRFYKQKKQRLL